MIVGEKVHNSSRYKLQIQYNIQTSVSQSKIQQSQNFKANSTANFNGDSPIISTSLLDLLLGPQLIAVSTLLLTAVHSPRVQTSIALPANHLVLVELTSQSHQ
uniref:Uncharacterized protein n=1 Tax=Opuntia streptacantha TaxID=393608 RepID=A0A7C8YMS5_OPUST